MTGSGSPGQGETEPTAVVPRALARDLAEASLDLIAAVQGHAVGAGFPLAPACDLRIVADHVQFAIRETALGLVPDLGGTKPLVDAVDYPRALEICATGRPVGAQEAPACGPAARRRVAGR